MWPFGKSLDQRAFDALDAVERRIDGLIKSEQEARARVAQLNKEAADNRKTIAEQAAKLRKQTAADLYLISAEIMQDILENGKVNPNDVAAQVHLQNVRDMQMRQQAASQMTMSGGYPNSLFDSLGL